MIAKNKAELSDAPIQRNITDDDEIPDWERLSFQINKWIAGTNLDLEELEEVIFKHICEYYALNVDEDFYEGAEGIKAHNMAWSALQDVISELDTTEINCERLKQYIWSFDCYHSYQQLICNFQDFLSPEEREEINSKAKEIFIPGIFDDFIGIEDSWTLPALLVQGIVTPIGNTGDGRLIEALSIPWEMIVRLLSQNWELAFQIPPDKWEELIAASFHQASYDEVILTPRSRDHGRDVIATKYGFGSIRIIGSVKAYKPEHLVAYDDVRALIGVLHGDRQASKGIITTTSDFPPGIMKE